MSKFRSTTTFLRRGGLNFSNSFSTNSSISSRNILTRNKLADAALTSSIRKFSHGALDLPIPQTPSDDWEEYDMGSPEFPTAISAFAQTKMPISGAPTSSTTIGRSEHGVPELPPVVKSLIYGNYNELDPEVEELLKVIENESSAPEMWGRGGSMKEHLIGVWKILKCWGLPDDICRLGLFQAAYGNSDIKMGLFNIEEDREKLRKLIGYRPEEWVF